MTAALRREAVFSGWLMTSFKSICGCQIALMATDLDGGGVVRGAAHQRGAAARAQALRRRIGGTPFNRVDPDNRLVAAELERRWEEALSEVRVAEEALVQQSSP
jgi:hypothetical protein